MKPINNPKVIRVLAEECESPGEFLFAVAAIRHISKTKFSQIMGTTEAYISMAFNDKCSFGTKACLKFAKALDIDPYLLASVASKYAIKKEIEKNEF